MYQHANPLVESTNRLMVEIIIHELGIRSNSNSALYDLLIFVSRNIFVRLLLVVVQQTLISRLETF